MSDIHAESLGSSHLLSSWRHLQISHNFDFQDYKKIGHLSAVDSIKTMQKQGLLV